MVYDPNARLLADTLKPVHESLKTWFENKFVTEASVARQVIWATPMRAWARESSDAKTLMLDDPAISIAMADIQLDRNRFSMAQTLYPWSGRYRMATDGTGHFKIFASPFKLTFQVDYWADTRVELNQFMSFLLYSFRPHLRLDIGWVPLNGQGQPIVDTTCVGEGLLWIQSVSDVSDLEYGGGKRDLRLTVQLEGDFYLPVAISKDIRIETIIVQSHLWNPVQRDSTAMSRFTITADSTSSRPWGSYEDTVPGLT